MDGNCTNRPDCVCAFCTLRKTKTSARDVERQEAEAYIAAFCSKRDREMDREATAAGLLPRTLESVLHDFDFELLYAFHLGR